MPETLGQIGIKIMGLTTDADVLFGGTKGTTRVGQSPLED